jgi:hypothetical protein
MNRKTLEEYKSHLESFLKDYNSFTSSSYYSTEELTRLQRATPLVSQIVSAVHGGGSMTIGKTTITFLNALGYSLTSTLPKEHENFVEGHIKLTLNQAIGNIVNGTIPTKEIKPVLPLMDQDLRKRCIDLLNAPGSFDRVIREATVILEDRLRNMVPREQLSTLIPLYADQTLERLINSLLSPEKPVLSVSPDKPDRVAFHRMMLGICAYLRNPFHHTLDNKTEWSLAWSVVGLVDSLLYDLSKSQVLEISETDIKRKGTR